MWRRGIGTRLMNEIMAMLPRKPLNPLRLVALAATAT
jgi:hypothetical protein